MTKKRWSENEDVNDREKDKNRSNREDRIEFGIAIKRRKRERWDNKLEERNRSEQEWEATIQLQEDDQSNFHAVKDVTENINVLLSEQPDQLI